MISWGERLLFISNCLKLTWPGVDTLFQEQVKFTQQKEKCWQCLRSERGWSYKGLILKDSSYYPFCRPTLHQNASLVPKTQCHTGKEKYYLTLEYTTYILKVSVAWYSLVPSFTKLQSSVLYLYKVCQLAEDFLILLTFCVLKTCCFSILFSIIFLCLTAWITFWTGLHKKKILLRSKKGTLSIIYDLVYLK